MANQKRKSKKASEMANLFNSSSIFNDSSFSSTFSGKTASKILLKQKNKHLFNESEIGLTFAANPGNNVNVVKLDFPNENKTILIGDEIKGQRDYVSDDTLHYIQNYQKILCDAANNKSVQTNRDVDEMKKYFSKNTENFENTNREIFPTFCHEENSTLVRNEKIDLQRQEICNATKINEDKHHNKLQNEIKNNEITFSVDDNSNFIRVMSDNKSLQKLNFNNIENIKKNKDEQISDSNYVQVTSNKISEFRLNNFEDDGNNVSENKSKITNKINSTNDLETHSHKVLLIEGKNEQSEKNIYKNSYFELAKNSLSREAIDIPKYNLNESTSISKKNDISIKTTGKGNKIGNQNINKKSDVKENLTSNVLHNENKKLKISFSTFSAENIPNQDKTKKKKRSSAKNNNECLQKNVICEAFNNHDDKIHLVNSVSTYSKSKNIFENPPFFQENNNFNVSNEISGSKNLAESKTNTFDLHAPLDKKINVSEVILHENINQSSSNEINKLKTAESLYKENYDFANETNPFEIKDPSCVVSKDKNDYNLQNDDYLKIRDKLKCICSYLVIQFDDDTTSVLNRIVSKLSVANIAEYQKYEDVFKNSGIELLGFLRKCANIFKDNAKIYYLKKIVDKLVRKSHDTEYTSNCTFVDDNIDSSYSVNKLNDGSKKRKVDKILIKESPNVSMKKNLIQKEITKSLVNNSKEVEISFSKDNNLNLNDLKSQPVHVLIDFIKNLHENLLESQETINMIKKEQQYREEKHTIIERDLRLRNIELENTAQCKSLLLQGLSEQISFYKESQNFVHSNNDKMIELNSW
ncbi:hypothetical protein EDEG_02250 [Edhazardia aedis USNM 41457]|uniref:Uncharacterized protein n=1 Tax=Edhazardia aedis (strain USNM 41457) TaxID=1003232 RepID=J8ZUN4_EDHAE|nr:hypothetical protein EDEG_02250 [Edhazardia aedis USNM 41457]|eukprot:EJW03393.1 hypothetical protein EDEG_02250 [Edhazardia aedis USNM 41457]